MVTVARGLSFAALLIALAGCVSPQDNLSTADRPNIVLIISDDQDYEHFGFMGHPLVRTPALDELAEAGALFTTAHVPMSRCRPTLASFLSGRYPHQSGIYYNFGTESLDPTDSLARLLRDSGYATFASGKFWEGDPRAMGFTHGEGRTANRFVRKHQKDAFDFIDSVAGKQPFFVWWAPKLSHTPHNPPNRFRRTIDPSEVSIPDGFAGDPRAFAFREHTLLAMDAWLDEGVRDLVAHLREKDLYENTLFVFVVDNGWSNGLVSKGSPYEKGLRTPVFLTWPKGIEGGRRFDQLVSSLDLYPTILDYAGVKTPRRAAGRNLRPFLEGKTDETREALYGAVYPAFATKGDERPERDVYALYVRTAKWKYVLYLQDVRKEANGKYLRIQHILTDFPTRSRGDEDLFDLERDPHERTNLAATQGERCVRFRRQVMDWWKRSGGRPLVRRQDAKRPNIIYILADDLGYGELGCFGQSKIKTPNIDKLAAEGMRFTQHYSGSPVCAPSRCVFMTGLHTGHAYVRDNKGKPIVGQLPIPEDTVTVARLLQKAGYRTGGTGKWGLGGPDTTGVPNKQGFDHWFGYLDQWNAHSYFPDYLWRNEEKITLEGNAGDKQETYSHDLIADEALQFIRDKKEGQPFFLFVAFTIPHVSLHVPEDSLAEYKGKWPETPYKGGHYAGHETPRAAYAAMITRMDRDVGRIMALLKEKGLDEETLVIFTSDNGPTYAGGVDYKFFESAGPLRGLKGSLYEGGIRIPFVARWPGTIQSGTTSAHPSAFWDMLPTFTELAGAETPERIDGLSMVPTLLGRPGEQRDHDYLYWEYRSSNQAVRMGDWKAVRLKPGDPIQLFNLKNDLGEARNVAAEHPGVVRRMADIMKKGRTPSEHFPIRFPGKLTLATENAIPKAAWKLVRVDSESTFNGKVAANAFDNDPQTWWHTQWRDAKPGHPHELVIDLGARHRIKGIRYLPRMDGGTNGTIDKFEFTISDDPDAFGEPVLKSRFKKVKKEQEQTFEATTGRYIRLRTLSAHGEVPFASVGELGLIGE